MELEEIHAVWYRSPEAYDMPAELSPVERQHCTREVKYGLGGVLASLPALWVNHPSRLADCAYKPVQLARAHEYGLSVPDTVITNEPDTVRSFAAGGQTITKLMGANTISEEGRRKLSWTRVLGRDELDDLRGFSVTSHLVQRWVPKLFEVRIVVIADQLTAVKIISGSAASHIDWRSDYAALTYDLIEPPDHVTHSVRALMRSFDLVYAALDLIVTPDAEWVFLEINAGGQYGWLEAKTGVPLTVDGVSGRRSHEGKAVTTSLDTGWAPRAQRLADLLAERGDLRNPAWKDAVVAVARHVLVPAAYRQDNTGAWHSVT
ncbi:MAG: MvdC/MvdD family ATP grasp protein [Pseudonocardiaceae bacterium]